MKLAVNFDLFFTFFPLTYIQDFNELAYTVDTADSP